MIDDPKAFEKLVSDAEWKILGADELSEEKMKDKKYEKWLTSQNMQLPPKPKKKKKKKVVKPDTPVDQQVSETDSDISDGQPEDALENKIIKKFPDYKQCKTIVADLKKTFP